MTAGVRRLRAADLDVLQACGPACGLASWPAGELGGLLTQGSVRAWLVGAEEPSPEAPLLVAVCPEVAGRGDRTPGPVSADAWGVVGLRGDASTARRLVRAASADLARLGGVRALETWPGVGDPCRGDLDRWAELGFAEHRPHPVHPRLRLDLRAMPVLRVGAASAWDRARAEVTGLRRPRPATEGRVQRSSRSSASRS